MQQHASDDQVGVRLRVLAHHQGSDVEHRQDVFEQAADIGVMPPLAGRRVLESPRHGRILEDLGVQTPQPRVAYGMDRGAQALVEHVEIVGRSREEIRQVEPAGFGRCDALHFDLPGVLVGLHITLNMRQIAGGDAVGDVVDAIPQHAIDLAAAIGELEQEEAMAAGLFPAHLLFHHEDAARMHPRHEIGEHLAA